MSTTHWRGVVTFLATAALTGVVGLPPALAAQETPPGAAAPATGSSALPSLLPRPVSYQAAAGEAFTLTPDSVVLATGEAAVAVAEVVDELRTSTGYALPVLDPADAGQGTAPGITAVVSPEALDGAGVSGEEAYTITVDADGVTLRATTAHGLYDATRSLKQLLGPWSGSATVVSRSWTVPALSLKDSPRYSYRGLMLDPARSFITVPEVLDTIETMADYKLNELHLHLSDDQGWRIAITNEGRAEGDTIDYTRLAEVSGATAVGPTRATTLPGVTGYYTQDDFRTIVAAAAAHHIEVVPEIDAPAHTNAALHALPELNSSGSFPAADPLTGTTPVNTTTSVGESSLDAANEASYTYIRHVVNQIAAMNPEGRLLHLGGDESFSTTAQAYRTFMDRALTDVAGTTNSSGRPLTPVVWNEAASRSTLPQGTYVQVWRSHDAAAVARHVADGGGKVIVSLAQHTYFPQRPTADVFGATWACGGPCGMSAFYDYDPATVAGVPEAGVAGVEGAVWNEHLRGLPTTQYMVYPRLLALAEVAWSPQEAREGGLRDLESRIADQGAALSTSGVNFHPTPEVPWTSQLTTVPAVGGPDTLLTVALLARPGVAATQISASLTWSDGSTTPVSVTTERELVPSNPSSTEGRQVNGLYRLTVASAGTARTGTLEVTTPDGTLQVPVSLAGDPGDPDNPGGPDQPAPRPGDDEEPLVVSNLLRHPGAARLVGDWDGNGRDTLALRRGGVVLEQQAPTNSQTGRVTVAGLSATSTLRVERRGGRDVLVVVG